MYELTECTNAFGVGDRELFIVEGISAANAAAIARDPRTQAVLAIQGKPMNVERASRRDIAANEKLRDVVRAIGAWSGDAFDLDSVQYDRVLILTDGDADGVHASALLVLAFDYLMPELIESGRLSRIRAPLFAMRCSELVEATFAFSTPHRDRIRTAMDKQGITGIEVDYLKSIAGLNADELWSVCLDPNTRVGRVLTRDDAATARETLTRFGQPQH